MKSNAVTDKKELSKIRAKVGYLGSMGRSERRKQAIRNFGRRFILPGSPAKFVLLFLLLCPFLLSAQTPNASTGVQGIVPPVTNGNAVLPIINGSLKPAINGTTAVIGVDTSSATGRTYAGGLTGNLFIGTAPAPTKPTEFAIAVVSVAGSIGGAGLASPQWTCVTGFNCLSNTPQVTMMYQQNVTATSSLSWNAVNSSGPGNWYAGFVEFATNNGQAPILRGGNIVGGPSIGTSVNTLAGSTVLAAFSCFNFPCFMAGPPTDSQGNLGTLVSAISGVSGCSTCGQYVYVFGPTSAAAETVVALPLAGTTITGGSIVELSGLIPANLNRPVAQIGSSNNTFASTLANTQAENDAGGIFTESAGFNFKATLTISAPTTAIPLWDITQHGVFQSCTVFERVTGATGTTPTLNAYLQDSPDALGWNDHISMPQATAAGAWEGIAPVFTGASLAAIASGAVVTTNKTLAAGSVVPGPMAAYGQIVFVTTGTTPVFTVNLGVTCK